MDENMKLEVEKLLSGKHGKVLPGICDVKATVIIHLPNLDLKFQLLDGYPNTAPLLHVKLKFEVEGKDEKVTELCDQAELSRGSPMLSTLTSLAEDLFSSSEETVANPETKSVKRKPKTKSKREIETAHKKPPMKTATDVINRIMWDDHLTRSEFIIGYLDRFIGVVEKCFLDFSWEDIASVDRDTLAIPKHRINYFKWKGIKIWDKHDRLDNVFGSTGSGLTIIDVINMKNDQLHKQEDPEIPSQDLNDDEMKLSCLSLTDACVSANKTQVLVYDTRRNTLRPTHFVCFQVDDCEVLESVEKFHSYVAEEMPVYTRLLVPISKLHVTLLGLHLDSSEKITCTKNVFNKLSTTGFLQEMQEGHCQASISNVQSHADQVVYSQVHPFKQIEPVLKYLRENLASFLIEETDNLGLHLTLLKLRKSDANDLGIQSLKTVIFQRIKNFKLGTQTLNHIHLCELSSCSKNTFFNIIATI